MYCMLRTHITCVIYYKREERERVKKIRKGVREWESKKVEGEENRRVKWIKNVCALDSYFPIFRGVWYLNENIVKGNYFVVNGKSLLK